MPELRRADESPFVETHISVLLVEDDLQMRELCKHVLEHEGYEVHTARTAADMLVAVERHLPDVVVADLKLPDASGHEVIERLRGSGCRVPIVVVTGSIEIARKDTGIVAWFMKPVPVPLLLSAVNDACPRAEGRKRGRRAMLRMADQPGSAAGHGSGRAEAARQAKRENSSAPVIQLRTIGASEIRIGNRVVGPSAGHPFNCLLYLLLARESVGRDLLCELFWAGTDKAARARLSRVLADIRKLGTDLSRDEEAGEGIAVEGGRIRVDFHDLGSVPLTNVGPVLPGVTGPVGFAAWISGMRDSIEDALLIHLQGALSASEAASRWDEVANVARAVLRVDGTNQEAVFGLARSLCFLGRKHQALRILADYIEGLRREDSADDYLYGIEAAVWDLRQRIAAVEPPAPIAVQPDPFAGRKSHLETADAVMARVRARKHGDVLWFSGPERIGKTRLLREIALRASLMKVEVVTLVGRAGTQESDLPVVSALARRLRQMPGLLEAANAQHLRMIDEILAAGALPASDGTSAMWRSGLGLALAELLGAVTQNHAIVVTIDDADRLSAAEARVTGALADRIRGTRVALFLTSRQPLDAVSGWPLDLPHLALGPLSGAESEWLVRELAGDEVYGDSLEDLIGKVGSLAEGYPWIVAELVAEWRRTGRVDALPPSVVVFARGLRGAQLPARSDDQREPADRAVADRDMAERPLAAPAVRLSHLTARQQKVALLVGEGYERSEVAKRLTEEEGHAVTARTVGNHVQAIAAHLPPGEGTATSRVREWVRNEVRREGGERSD